MNRIFILLSIFTFAITLYAQPVPDWQWVIGAGGTSPDNGRSIVTDSSGNVYTTGNYAETAYFGILSLTSAGDNDVFVMKTNPSGIVQWVVSAGGTGTEYSYSLTLDGSGNIYITGVFQGTASFGTISLTSNGGYDIFIAKLNNTGNWLWAVSAGGEQADYGLGICTQGSNLYVCGYFYNIASFGSMSLTSSGQSDIFVAKLNTNGNWLWVTKAGGMSYDISYDMLCDQDGNVHIAGYFSSSATFGTLSLTSSGDRDICVAKLNTEGTWLWATKAGGSGWDAANGIARDNNGNIYVTGTFKLTATFGSYTLTTGTYNDIFVAKLNSSGSWSWARQAGGISSDYGNSVCVDPNGNVYVTGYYDGTASFGTLSLTTNGVADIFVTKLDTGGNWLWVKGAGGTNNDYGQDITLDTNGNLYVTGYLLGTAYFGTNSITSVTPGYADIFIAKLSSASAPATPLAPQNLIITKSGNDMLLEWNPVTEDTYGQPVTPDYYEVYYHPSDPYADLLPLGQAAGTTYTHTGAALLTPGFYFVKAIKMD